MTEPASTHETNLRKTLLILAAAAAGMGALLAFLPAGGHDQLWCLYVAKHVLDGTPLYGPELLESNPPLIIWLSMLPALAEKLTGVSAAAAGKFLVICLQLLVAALTLRQIRRLLPNLGRAATAALLFAFIAVFDVVPARDLGQRDYLLALLCLPYLLAAAETLQLNRRQTSSWTARLLFGVMAGFGLALKPHQAILAIAAEAYLILRARSLRSLLRPEPIAIVAVGVAYFASIHRFTPAYLTDILPLLRDTYWAVGSLSLPELLWQAIELHLLAAAAIFVWHRGRRKQDATPQVVPLLLVAGCASTLAYYLQGTGWYYQQLPAITFFAAALVCELLPRGEVRVAAWAPKAAFALSLLALALTTHFMNYPFTEDRSFAIDTPDPSFFTNLAPGTAVATLTTTVDYTVMPAARYHLTIAQRYPHLWMLPAILRNEDPGVGHAPRHVIPAARLAYLDTLQHRFMTQDLARWRPELVLVQRCYKAAVHCQLLEDRDDDLLAWFLRDPDFAAEWSHYMFSGHRDQFDAYTRRP